MREVDGLVLTTQTWTLEQHFPSFEFFPRKIYIAHERQNVRSLFTFLRHQISNRMLIYLFCLLNRRLRIRPFG